MHGLHFWGEAENKQKKPGQAPGMLECKETRGNTKEDAKQNERGNCKSGADEQ